MWRRPFNIALLTGAFLFSLRSFASDWTMLGGGPEHLGLAQEEVAPPYSLVWTFKAEPERRFPASPVVVGGRVFFVSRAMARCLDIETGAEVWRYKLPSPSRCTPAFGEGRLFVGADDGRLYCLEARTGRLLWQYVTGGPVRGAPTVVGEVVLIGSDDDFLHAVEAKTGRRLWAFKAGSDVSVSPAVKEGLVVFSSTDRYVYALSLRTGGMVWKFDTRTTNLFAPPTAGDGVVYVPAGERLLCLALRSGRLLWAFPAGGTIASAPALAEGTLYFGAQDGNVYALDAKRGTLMWRASLQWAVWGGVVVTGRFVLVGTEGGMVFALDRGSGERVWAYRIHAISPEEMDRPFGVTSAPTVAGGMVFVFGEDGILYAFSPRGIDEAPPRVERAALILKAEDGSFVAFDLEGGPEGEGPLVIPGVPPLKFVAFVFDQGSGTKADSIAVTLNGRPIRFEYDQVKGRLSADLVSPTGEGVEKPLPDGRYVLVVAAEDWAGRSARKAFIFMVDNTLPPPPPPEERRGPEGFPGPPGMPFR